MIFEIHKTTFLGDVENTRFVDICCSRNFSRSFVASVFLKYCVQSLLSLTNYDQINICV